MPELCETFDKDQLSKSLCWFNEPSVWRIDTQQQQLILTTDRKTDFWQRTHYGFRNDNGHFLYAESVGDFVLEAEVSYAFQHQYDHAGLMVRISPESWIKTSVEYETGEPCKLGAVVTHHGFSDWSTQEFSGKITSLAFRIRREKDTYIVYWREGGSEAWIQLRMTHLEGETVQCGLYACSPKENGFTASFHYLTIS